MGESELYIKQALLKLGALEHCSLLKSSSLYRTKPWGYKDQQDFINAACVLNTTLKPYELLQKTQALEQEFHRERHFKYGPRTLDIDLIAYDELVLKTEHLTLPHEHMQERAFVLVPLAEIAPDFKIAPHFLKIRELKETLSLQELQEVQRLG